MTGALTDRVGFGHPNRGNRWPLRHAASIELVACLALVLSTVVAVMVVSIGIARAEGPGAVATADDGTIAVAAMLSAIFAVWGGLTALMARGSKRHG